MNKQALEHNWDQMRVKYGVYLRLLERIPENCYHTHPVPELRTFAELAAHVGATVIRDLAQGIAKGEITADEAAEAALATGFRTKADLVGFSKECWDLADKAVARIGDEQLEAMVPTPWGMSFPGWVGIEMIRDEFLHHRGQLYVYARIFGIAPPFIWGFGENEPAFQHG